jgi:hypothetical protein
MYQEGALKTWCDPNESQVECRRFMGNDPRWLSLTRVLNRLLTSRFLSDHWEKFQSSQNLNEISVRESKDVIKVDLSELWTNITLKSLVALRFSLKNYEFDYLLRVNSTCYVNIRLLRTFLKDNDQAVDYCGPVAKGKDFVSGWGIVLSRRATELLVSSFSKGDLAFFDDEAIGRILRRVNVLPQEFPFIEINSQNDLNHITKETIRHIPFFRMKVINGKERIDHRIMRLLHNRVKSLS